MKCWALGCQAAAGPLPVPFCQPHWDWVPGSLQVEVFGGWDPSPPWPPELIIAMGKALRHLYILERGGTPPDPDDGWPST
jgi:hypothetical protein